MGRRRRRRCLPRVGSSPPSGEGATQREGHAIDKRLHWNGGPWSPTFSCLNGIFSNILHATLFVVVLK
jgi:uncharacterized protein YhdP